MNFAESLQTPLKAAKPSILQINVGYLCNLSCKHCHVGAGPLRKETAGRDVLEAVINVLRGADIPTVDITGGAPEMNPHFRWFLYALRELKRNVTVRSNLAILDEEGYGDLPELYAQNRIELVASLPGADAARTDNQRGRGVFARAVNMMKKLNTLGYAQPGTGLKLNIAHNPAGAYMPGSQQAIEDDYRNRLWEEHGVEFNTLYCITNLPVGRFESYLAASGNYGDYMETLAAAFNKGAVESLMCRFTVSVDWRGKLYDCDFNQCKGLSVSVKGADDIWHYDHTRMEGREIVTGEHCYGCTAGAGSSCRGNIA